MLTITMDQLLKIHGIQGEHILQIIHSIYMGIRMDNCYGSIIQNK